MGIQIVSGRLKPGTILEGEIVASDQRKVSRSAYREAVRILTAKGLVQSKPKTGTRVNERAVWHLLDPDVLSWIFQLNPNKELLVDIFELRKIVEPEAAALAAHRRTSRHLKAMATALDGMALYSLARKEGQEADLDFHTALLEASDNLVLRSLTTSINAAVGWSTIFKQRYEPLHRDAVLDHRKVYNAVAAGDPAAARRAMVELVDLAYSDIVNAPKSPVAPNGTRSRAVKARRGKG
jgi:DNA-binding FadR family transcriptional regulator